MGDGQKAQISESQYVELLIEELDKLKSRIEAIEGDLICLGRGERGDDGKFMLGNPHI